MRFTALSPTEFALLFSAAALLATLIYLVSFRKRTVLMATEPIWRLIAGKRRTPYRRLLALLLQIAVLFLLSMALGDPRLALSAARRPVTMAIVVDVSASMSAQDQGLTRLERAKDLARALIQKAGPQDRLALLTMAENCRPQTPFVSASPQLETALADLQVLWQTEQVASTLAVAKEALVGADPRAWSRRRLVIVSDHFFDLPPADDEIERIQLAVGRRQDNLSLTALEARLATGPVAGSEVFVEVRNHGRSRRQARLVLHTPELLLGDEIVVIEAGGSLSRNYLLKPLRQRRLLASLLAVEGQEPVDGFAIDNRAFSWLPRARARKIRLVAENNLYLEKALALHPSVSLQVIKPSQYQAQALAGADAVVFAGICPAVSIPALYFHPPAGGNCPFVLADEVSAPKLLPLAGDHPVTRELSLPDLHLSRAHHLVPQAGDVELLGDDKGPFVLAREEKGQKMLALGFALGGSDLPLRVAFPLLLHNCLDWFLGENEEQEPVPAAVGRPWLVPAWVRAQSTFQPDAGDALALHSMGEQLAVRPNSPGFLSLQQDRRRLVLAVNFHMAGESDLGGDRTEGQNQWLWHDGPAPALATAGLGGQAPAVPEPQWPLLLLAAAWLLLFDWVFFCFRILF